MNDDDAAFLVARSLASDELAETVATALQRGVSLNDLRHDFAALMVLHSPQWRIRYSDNYTGEAAEDLPYRCTTPSDARLAIAREWTEITGDCDPGYVRPLVWQSPASMVATGQFSIAHGTWATATFCIHQEDTP